MGQRSVGDSAQRRWFLRQQPRPGSPTRLGAPIWGSRPSHRPAGPDGGGTGAILPASRERGGADGRPSPEGCVGSERSGSAEAVRAWGGGAQDGRLHLRTSVLRPCCGAQEAPHSSHLGLAHDCADCLTERCTQQSKRCKLRSATTCVCECEPALRPLPGAHTMLLPEAED